MRTPFALPGLVLGFVFCTLPLLSAEAERRVAAPCELTSATVIGSGKQSEAAGREFVVRVINNSARTIALPRSPVFGWSVESLDKRGWLLKAEGGPVRRVNRKDEWDGHVAVIGTSETTPLVEISPTRSEDFHVFLPEASKALQPEALTMSTLKLTLFWAAPPTLAQSNHAVPLCALAPEWVLKVQKLSPN